MIKDSFGRPVLNLRISVTQRCNLHCPYCHREGQEKQSYNVNAEMTTDEIARLVKIAISLEIKRIKLTGGEPLLRNDILDIVRKISSLDGLKDFSMTTNGVSLSKLAKKLHINGLMRINVSLPSLNPRRYEKIMGGNLNDVLKGIKTTVDVGFDPVKLNMLLLAGINDKEIDSMINFARKTNTVLQLIELEPINLSKKYYERHHYPLDQIESTLNKKAISVETREYMQNRRIYKLSGTTVEVIRPIENTEFCAHCTRLRVTSDGKLKPCLMVNNNLVDVLTPMREGINDNQLRTIFIETCLRREPYNKSLTEQL